MAAKVGRNAPCPCGSGKKYKRCCGLDQPADAPVLSNRSTTILLSICVLVAVGLLVTAVVLTREPPRVGTTPTQGSATETYEPWHYDAANDRYWHIDGSGAPGHWHPGRPPVQANDADSATPNPDEPAPNEYDAANDRYWHVPVDGAPGHWHQGRPPATNETVDR